MHKITDFIKKTCCSGANIGLKNLHGEAPISRILPSTMEEYLNKHCMRTSGNPTNDEFKYVILVHMNYSLRDS